MTEETDLVYDRLVAEEKLQHGTKYERLAAFVFKLLDEQSAVVHDLHLRGPGKKAEHQIDVTVTSGDSESIRLIIECRDKDEGNKIGQGAMRDFATVVRSLDAEGLMLTTTGYTKGAGDVAEDEGIRLGLLRHFEESDWDGRIRLVKVDLKFQIPTELSVELGLKNPGTLLGKTQLAPGNTQVTTPDGSNTIEAIVREALSTVGVSFTGDVEIDKQFPDQTTIALDDGSFALGSLTIRAHMSIRTSAFEIGPPGVAELILELLDAAPPRMRVIYDRDLRRVTLGPDGTVNIEP